MTGVRIGATSDKSVVWRSWGGSASRRGARLMMGVGLLGMLFGASPHLTTGAEEQCQTPFVVYTDPTNPGIAEANGEVTVIRDSGLLGEYGGSGRFAGYGIQGTMDNILNTATGMARVQGEFVATSPDGASSITVWYTGQVDFGAGMAAGSFTAGNGTGADLGYRAHGTLEGVVTPPATLTGADVGLC